MADPVFYQLPAAERLKLAVTTLDSKLDNTFPRAASIDKQILECSCDCHAPRTVSNKWQQQLAGRYAAYRWPFGECGISCATCRQKNKESLLALIAEYSEQMESCCTGYSWDYVLTGHFQSHEHILNRMSVYSGDLSRLRTIQSAVPQMNSHPELWVPLMKAAYTHAQIQRQEIIPMRLEYIARQLVEAADTSKTALKLKPLYPSRISRKEASRQAYISDSQLQHVSLTGIVIDSDPFNLLYLKEGQTIAYSLWGE